VGHKEGCTESQTPSGMTFSAIEYDPNDPTRLISVAYDGAKTLIMRSTDSGASFKQVSELGGGLGKIAFDPRGGHSNVYVLDLAARKLMGSTDGGLTWADVSPPSNLDPVSSSSIHDFDVLADGAIVGVSLAGTLRRAAPN